MAKTKKDNNFIENLKVNNEIIVPLEEEVFGVSQMTVKKVISIQEFVKCVDDIVSNCFDDSGMYLSSLEDFATAYMIVTYYSDYKLPNDTNDASLILYGTDIRNQIISVMRKDQYTALMFAVDEEVKNRNAEQQAIASRDVLKLLERMDALTANLEDMSGLFETGEFVDAMNKLTSELKGKGRKDGKKDKAVKEAKKVEVDKAGNVVDMPVKIEVP